MMQPYQINNTATMIYSYVIDPNRPPVAQRVEDSASNLFLPGTVTWLCNPNEMDACYENRTDCYSCYGTQGYDQGYEDPEEETATSKTGSNEAELPQCREDYTLPDSVVLNTGQNVRGIRDVSVSLNTIESVSPVARNAGETQNGLLIRGSYLIGVDYFDRRYRVRQYTYRRNFETVVQLEETCTNLRRVSGADLKIANVVWEANRLNINTQLDVKIEQ